MNSLSWKNILVRELSLLGRRNWIGVVDAAYPWQTSPGIETVATRASHLTVLKTVLSAVRHAPHVHSLVHLDVELAFLPETDAPGIGLLRGKIDALLASLSKSKR